VVQDLNYTDRGILESRPEISFVEPAVLPVEARPIPAELPKVDAVKLEVQQTKALANAVDVLAGLVQARVDFKAKDMEIDLDPRVDAAVIAAMKRMYPEAENPTVITYPQYIACKNRLLARGTAIADQALVYSSPSAIAEARKAANVDTPESEIAGLAPGAGLAAGSLAAAPIDPTTGQPVSAGGAGGLGGAAAGVPLGLDGQPLTTGATSTAKTVSKAPNPFYEDYEGTKKAAQYGSKKAKRGGLRPELDQNNMIIEPLDIEEFQDFLIRILVNFIWKWFIRPILYVALSSMIPFAGEALPKQLCKYPNGITVGDLLSMGLPILGEKKPKQQEAPKPDASAVGG
jgi:hypothetical protein